MTENHCDPMLTALVLSEAALPTKESSQPEDQPPQGNAARGNFEAVSILLFQGMIYSGAQFHKTDGQKGWISYYIVRGESLDPSRSVAKLSLTSMGARIQPSSALHWMLFHMKTLCHSETDVDFSFFNTCLQ